MSNGAGQMHILFKIDYVIAQLRYTLAADPLLLAQSALSTRRPFTSKLVLPLQIMARAQFHDGKHHVPITFSYSPTQICRKGMESCFTIHALKRKLTYVTVRLRGKKPKKPKNRPNQSKLNFKI